MKFKKFKIKGKIWSLSYNYRISDENDMEAYVAEGRRFSFHTKLSFKDWKGKELFLIEKKNFSLRPTFYLRKNGVDLFKVVKKISFKPTIVVESLAEQEAFKVTGNLWGNEYKFIRDDEEFAIVSRNIWKISGVYGAAVSESADESTVLALVVIIDLIRQSEEGGAAG